ncbi:surface antigen [Plasmodium falciparum UGT5.1]|uniref:Surface antigen n=1 Tax=Plasmodium falciparum UGT5.1 TaxID=1237627 RepID=W7JID3_PLAFA|nr:surface antigen [Plasmodium falciparum UGT5.1]
MKFYNFKCIIKKKAYFTTQHTSNTKSIKPHRSLCECELYDRYIPIYDYNQEMKEVMQQFDERTSQRFREYDERMQEKRQTCKEQCDKDMQKIILKDKIEKELTEKLSALQTDISINDIPTCICEKSLADKVEKNCLKCGGDIRYGAGMREVVSHIKEFLTNFNKYLVDLTSIVDKSSYNCGTALHQSAKELVRESCAIERTGGESQLCNNIIHYNNTSAFNGFAEAGADAYKTTLEAKMAEIPTFNTAMTASIIAIVVIVLVMVIIYLILRYRRKKKMKKKVQYMKLLKE